MDSTIDWKENQLTKRVKSQSELTELKEKDACCPKDKKLLFVEKLSFSLPYQVLKFENRKQLKNYLMGMYDISWGQEEAKPFIMENTKTAL